MSTFSNRDLALRATELDDAAVAALLTEIDERGEDIGGVRLWWHSHGDLGVFWSSTDEECAAGLANSRYFVSIVVNKKGDIKCRVDLYEPLRVTMDELSVETVMPDFGTLEQCTAEFKAKVTETEPLMVCHGAFGYDCQPYEYLTEEQVKELNELEDKMERGISYLWRILRTLLRNDRGKTRPYHTDRRPH